MKNFRELYKTLARPSATDMVNLCVLKALTAKSNSDRVVIARALLARAFTPITNKNKLANGCQPYDGLKTAIGWCRWNTTNPDLVLIFGAKATFLFDTPNEFDDYVKLLNDLKEVHTQDLHRHYCYVFVDMESVSPEQAMVQAAHATMVVGANMSKRYDPHKVYYQIVEKPEDLFEFSQICDKYKVHHFVESDLGDRVIASATEPVLWANRRDLMNYKLVTFNKVA